MTTHDLIVRTQVTIRATTDAGRAWIEQRVPPYARRRDGGVEVSAEWVEEHVGRGARIDGLTVGYL